MEINVKNIDECKASPKKVHVFFPKAINEGLKDDEKIKVTCQYFKSLEKLDYAKYDADGTMRYDLKGIFRDKVSSIENLALRDEDDRRYDIKAPDDALGLVSIPEIDGMIVEVAMHLIKGDSLTEDEVKNSESAINS